MTGERVFTLSQVAQHKSNKDCWFIINGRVLDVTKFLEDHPGGVEVLMETAGKDASKDFEVIGHSKAAQSMLVKYQVGVLPGFTFQQASDTKDITSEETRGREMTGFVIKHDWVRKYSKVLDLFVPLVVASVYLGYRLSTALDKGY